MSRTRLSTTVDAELLEDARRLTGEPDARMVDAALRALLAAERRTEIDRADAEAYAAHPLDEPDAWGDLESFHAAASRS